MFRKTRAHAFRVVAAWARENRQTAQMFGARNGKATLTRTHKHKYSIAFVYEYVGRTCLPRFAGRYMARIEGASKVDVQHILVY